MRQKVETLTAAQTAAMMRQAKRFWENPGNNPEEWFNFLKTRVMEKQIIDGSMNIDQRIELESAIYDIVKTSMDQRCLSLAWWETYCSVDFFNELNEVTDDFGNVLGKGIETEDCIYVLNEKSEFDFTTSFHYGKDRAIQEIKKKHAPNPMTWMAPFIGGMGG